MRRFLRIAGYFLTERIYVEVPSSLAAWSSDAIALFKKARLLRANGRIDEWRQIFRDFPDEPFLYAFESALGGEAIANGSDPFDKDAALIRMLAESHERALWKRIDISRRYPTRIGTTHDLRDERAVPPSAFTGFSDRQLRRHPLLAKRAEASYTWVKIPSIIDRRPAWVPLQTVSLLHHKKVLQETSAEPLVREMTTNGLATGPTLETALCRGLLEVIERDAFMVNYLGALAAPRLDVARMMREEGSLGLLLRECKRYDLTVHLIGLLTDFPVHCLLAVVEDTTGAGPEITVGARAGFSLEDVAKGALTEALYCRYIYRKEKLAERPLPDDISDYGLIDRIAYWGHGGRSAEIGFFTRGRSTVYSRTVQDGATEKERLRILTRALKDKGLDAYYAEYTDDIGKRLGWHSVFAVVPGLQPMYFNESAPHCGGERLASVPRLYGYEAPRVPPPVPHPFP